MKTVVAALVAVLALPGAAPLGAQTLSGEAIFKHVKVLADDAMEGRGTGSPGERRAAAYVEAEFRKAGLDPAAGGGFVQEVPMVGITADPTTVLTFEGPGRRLATGFFEEAVVGSGVTEEKVAVDAEVVFVGYGISAPEQKWDDFKGVDVRGKVLLALVNDPPSDDPAVFGGRAMTYYGRWTYKYEEAARRGAAGILLVHMEDKAGYPWQVVQKSWSGEQFQVAEQPSSLRLRGWLRGDVAARVVEAGGRNLPTLVAAAGRPDFQPVPLGMRVKTEIRSTVRKLSAPNVVGVLRGTERPDRFVCLVAHHDHFGIGRPDATGDRIYNGASDNATGMGVLIELARTLAASRPKDSVVFMTVTAEEQGLLGSLYYTLHPLVPLSQTAAAISLDGINVLGATRDVNAVGSEQSDLGRLVAAVASDTGLTVKPDPHPERGGFFRSDHFSFARAGVPGMTLSGGDDYVGKPEGWGEQKAQEYLARHYHQPSDQVGPEWETGGFVQVGEFTLRLLDRMAREKDLVRWNPDSAYQRR